MDLLLVAMLSCGEGKWILDGIYDVDLTKAERSDLVITITGAMPDDCPADFYVPGSRLEPSIS